jgi:hypothetical protein
LPSVSNKAGRNIVAVRRTPLALDVAFVPHSSSQDSFVTETMDGSKTKECHRPCGSIQQTIDMIRSRSVDCLIRQPEVIAREILGVVVIYAWFCIFQCGKAKHRHGCAQSQRQVQDSECHKEKAVEALGLGNWMMCCPTSTSS